MALACFGIVAVSLLAVFALAVWGLLLPKDTPFAAQPVSLADARDGDLVRVVGRIRDAEGTKSAFGEQVALYHLELREPGARFVSRRRYSRVLLVIRIEWPRSKRTKPA